MSSRRSHSRHSNASRITEEQINELVSKLQMMLPDAPIRRNNRVSVLAYSNLLFLMPIVRQCNFVWNHICTGYIAWHSSFNGAKYILFEIMCSEKDKPYSLIKCGSSIFQGGIHCDKLRSNEQFWTGIRLRTCKYYLISFLFLSEWYEC